MQAKSCVVVLDTNALHDVRLYLAYAEGKQRYPYESVEWNTTEVQIAKRVADKEIREALDPGRTGLGFHAAEQGGIRPLRRSGDRVVSSRSSVAGAAKRDDAIAAPRAMVQ